MKSIIRETDTNVLPADIVDLQRAATPNDYVKSNDLPEAKLPGEDWAPELSDLDRALVETAEEMDFDWPEFLPVERIRVGIAQITLALLLLAGLLAFSHFRS